MTSDPPSMREGEAWHARCTRTQLVMEIEQLREELRQLGAEIAMERHLRKAAERDLLAYVQHAETRETTPSMPLPDNVTALHPSPTPSDP